jgi:hypothetical protein
MIFAPLLSMSRCIRASSSCHGRRYRAKTHHLLQPENHAQPRPLQAQNNAPTPRNVIPTAIRAPRTHPTNHSAALQIP